MDIIIILFCLLYYFKKFLYSGNNILENIPVSENYLISEMKTNTL